MKNRRSAIATIAAAASLALVLGVSTPASAADVSGSLSCAANAQVKVTISVPANSAGRITWERPGYAVRPADTWVAVNYARTIVSYARNLGVGRWTIDSKFGTTATCVRL
jgi:hypothetical protein